MFKGRNWFRFFSISIIIGILTPIAIGMIFIIHASIVVVGPELFNSLPELTTKEEKMLSTLIAPKYWTHSSAWLAEHKWPYRNSWLATGTKDQTLEQWRRRQDVYEYFYFKPWTRLGHWIGDYKLPSRGGWLTTGTKDETPWGRWWREQLYGVIAYLLRGYERDAVVKKWNSNVLISFSDNALIDPVIFDQAKKVTHYLSKLLNFNISTTNEKYRANINIWTGRFDGRVDFHPHHSPDYFRDSIHKPDYMYAYYGEYTPFRLKMHMFDNREIDRIEGYGTYFTYAKKNRVEGVAYSNENHEIYQSKCYVWFGHSEQRKRELITECLIRSLGLFEATNPDYNPKTTSLKEKREAFQVSDPADLDTSLLRFLYSDRVRPGMTIHDLMKLAQSPSFNKFFED